MGVIGSFITRDVFIYGEASVTFDDESKSSQLTGSR